MSNIAVDEQTDKLVESLQDKIDWDVSKKEIVGKAVKKYYEEMTDE